MVTLIVDGRLVLCDAKAVVVNNTMIYVYGSMIYTLAYDDI